MNSSFRIWDIVNRNFIGNTYAVRMLAANEAYRLNQASGNPTHSASALRYTVRTWIFSDEVQS